MTIALRLPKELEERLTALAEKTNRSKSFLAREAIETHIEDLEDTFLAIQISKDPGRIYSSEEIRKMCGLDD